MVIENPLPPFSEWIPAGGGRIWLLVVGVLIAGRDCSSAVW